MPTKNIEQHAKKNEQSFLDAKKITLIIVFGLLMIGLVVLSFTMILTTFTFSDLWNTICNSFTNPKTQSMAIGMFILWISFVFVKFTSIVLPFTIRLKKLNIKVKTKDAILFYLTNSFLSVVSPGVLLVDPYNVWWLKKQGVSTAQAAAFVWINEFLYHVTIFFISFPFFCYFAAHFGDIINTDPKEGWITVILASTGFCVDLLMFGFYIITGFNKKFHFYLSRAFNRTKKFFRLKYHTKAQTQQTYIVQAHLHNHAKILIREYKDNLFILLYYLITIILFFSIMYASICLTMGDQINDLYSFSYFIKIFGIVGIVTTANRYLPIPGGEGLMQTELNVMLLYINEGFSKEVAGSIFLWKTSTYYLPGIIGLCGFIIYLRSYFKNKKRTN